VITNQRGKPNREQRGGTEEREEKARGHVVDKKKTLDWTRGRSLRNPQARRKHTSTGLTENGRRVGTFTGTQKPYPSVQNPDAEEVLGKDEDVLSKEKCFEQERKVWTEQAWREWE